MSCRCLEDGLNGVWWFLSRSCWVSSLSCWLHVATIAFTPPLAKKLSTVKLDSGLIKFLKTTLYCMTLIWHEFFEIVFDLVLFYNTIEIRICVYIYLFLEMIEIDSRMNSFLSFPVMILGYRFLLCFLLLDEPCIILWIIYIIST